MSTEDSRNQTRRSLIILSIVFADTTGQCNRAVKNGEKMEKRKIFSCSPAILRLQRGVYRGAGQCHQRTCKQGYTLDIFTIYTMKDMYKP